MDENHKDNSSKIELIKEVQKMTSNSKIKKSTFSFGKKLLNIFSFFGKLFLSLSNKINFCFSKCSILIQFPLSLILISIIMILFIFMIHIYFYSDLYVFNFSKVFKDEFLDLYITDIDDLKTELTPIIVKETEIDIENQLFFQVYFTELAHSGIMNVSKNFFPSFSENPGSTSLFSKLNNIKNTDSNFEIPLDKSQQEMEDSYEDNLGNFAKIYYYMFPYIWYKSLMTNSYINQSFFTANQMDSFDYLFFRYPKEVIKERLTNNFIPTDYLMNPIIGGYFPILDIFQNDLFNRVGWAFCLVDDFSEEINKTKYDFLTNITLVHLNKESDGSINKTFITCAEQYIRYDNRDFIIYISFYWNQSNLKDQNNDYTFLIIKDNFTGLLADENLTRKFSDNKSYVSVISDTTEYALSDMDFKLFHLNIYNIDFNFYTNGISYDSFNLDYLNDYSKYYSVGKKIGNYFKYYVTLYLYKRLFQNVKYTKIKKNRDTIFLYNFKNKDKIKQICEKIDFDSYRNYLSDTGIDCWNERTKKYFNKEKFLFTSLINDTNTIEPIYPDCTCLPLFCLKNYENLDVNLNNLEFVDEINLPNKCQNKFFKKDNSTSKTEYPGNNKISDLIDISSNAIDYNYIKFISLEFSQFPGYFFFIISQVQSSGEVYINTYYKLITKIEITILILVVLFIVSILSIIIIYTYMKKYSMIINNFKNKFELYVFHSEKEDEVEDYFSNDNNNTSKYIRIKENKKEEQLIKFNINDNNLLNDLFIIFSQAYNISKKDIEKFYLSKKNKSKNTMKLNMMREKNEIFKLLSSFCLYAPCFKLNLNFDYNIYENSVIIKKYNNYAGQLENIEKKQIKLTKNILIELISTECFGDYGLITNLNFGYVTNIKADSKKYSIKFTLFEHIIKDKKQKLEKLKDEKDIKNEKTKKLVLKGKNILLNIFKDRFEEDDYLNYSKLNIAFNFFLINSYYKYLRQIAFENTNF